MSVICKKGGTENENEIVAALLHVGGHSYNHEMRKEKLFGSEH
jgi:hypothetical protein